MFYRTLRYDEPLFRPPAEAYSAIIQATIGCSWNKCAFCEMYTSKKFKVRSINELEPEIKTLAQYYEKTKKVFIADGNAMVLSFSKLNAILELINNSFSHLQRVSAYALPKDILTKTDEELKLLREGGLKLLYIGIETGDDELLRLVNKGETYKSTIEGIRKAHLAGIDTSIMIINGLGGVTYSDQHARNSAKIINELNPRFLSTLTLSLPYGITHFQSRFSAEYQRQTLKQLFEELYVFIENLDVSHVIYRSNHVSNNIALEGVLSKDKEKLLAQLSYAISTTPVDMMPQEPPFL